MPFSFIVSDELRIEIKAMAKKDPALVQMLNKKIKQIAASDEFTIDHYKNLRNELSDYKRVHVGKSFVLLFKVYKKEKYILFDHFKHHDEAYKTK